MAKSTEAATDSGDNTIFHYDHYSQVPKEIQKYYNQRHSIFSKYDEGIWMTDDAWFGVTPEPIANKIAEHVAAAAPPTAKYLIDAFAGAGGNTIAFALSGRWERVFAIEASTSTHKCLTHNASIYGVQGLISARVGDCFEMIPKAFKSILKDAVVFASPPWGGPGYKDMEIGAVFDVGKMEPYGLGRLVEGLGGKSSKAKGPFARSLALYLPRTADLNQIAGFVEDDEKVEVSHYCMNGASKALVVYYGKWDFSQE